MTVYAVANARILDYEKYDEYLKASAGTIAEHGGKLLVASRDSKVLEGDPSPLTVVIEFPSMEAAQAWYDSAKYTEARKLRQRPGVSEGWFLLASQTGKK